jgi:glycine cleavage system H protein
MVALFVAIMFLGFVLVDRVVQAVEARRAAASKAGDLPWNVPKGFYISEGHTWFQPDSSGGFRVGADALVAHALGAVEKVVLPELGEQVQAGQPLFQLQYHGRGLKIPSSITGHVAALNPGLGKRPELVAQDPYGSGWICAITPTQPNAGSGGMRSGEKAAAWLEAEFHRFREFLSLQFSPGLALGTTSQDGGLAAVGSLNQLDLDVWIAFEAEFLRPGEASSVHEGSRTGP